MKREEAIKLLCLELYAIWQGAKEDLDPWTITFDELPEKHRTEYEETATDIIKGLEYLGMVWLADDQGMNLSELETNVSTIPLPFRTYELMYRDGWRKVEKP